MIGPRTDIVPELTAALKDKDDDCRLYALSLGKLDDDARGRAALTTLLKNKDERPRSGRLPPWRSAASAPRRLRRSRRSRP